MSPVASLLRVGISFLLLSASALASGDSNPAVETLGDSLLFHVSFDHETINADLSPAAPEDQSPDGNKGCRFINGVYGQAFFPAEKRIPRYILKKSGIAIGNPGAVLVWVSPQDWDRSQPESYVFFLRINAAQGQLMLAKSNLQGRSDRLYAFAKGGGDKGVSIGSGSTSGWSDGEWHLLAVNWGADWVAISVDGSPFSQKEVPELKNFGEIEWILLGNGNGGSRNIAYDEVMILDRSLSHEEVDQLYQSGIKGKTQP